MSKTVLAIIQRATRGGIPLESPSSVFGSSDLDALQLGDLANECAEELMQAHDWQQLKTQVDIAGDGSTTEFDLPDDFSRFTKRNRFWSSEIDAPLLFVKSETEWLSLVVRDVTIATNAMTVINNKIKFLDAPATGETVSYHYITDKVCASSGGTAKAEFDADDDVFRLDDKLLWLRMIWRWRSMKKLDYAEEMASSELAMSKRIGNDGGADTIVLGGRSRFAGLGQQAFPGTLMDS